MNIYEQIDALVGADDSCECKKMFEEILKHIEDIKRSIGTKEDRGEYYRFVNHIRKRLKADTRRGVYPEIRYAGNTYGVDINGYLYDKSNTRTLKANEAFEIYRFLYEHRDRLDRYVSS